MISFAYASISPSAYLVRGQKNPRSPSPFVLGTTWTCRWGTDWLTTLLIADERSLGAERDRQHGRHALGHRHHRAEQLRWQIREGGDMSDRCQEDMTLEDRPMVEERNHVVVAPDHAGLQLAADDLADDVVVEALGTVGHLSDAR